MGCHTKLSNGFFFALYFFAIFFIASSLQAQNWFLGHWRGFLLQPNISQSYHVNMLVNQTAINSVVGSTFYQELNCGGDITLESVTANVAIFFENITFGNCLDGRIRLTRVSNTSATFDWFTPSGSQWIFNGPLSRLDANICNNAALRNEYSPIHPAFHYYASETVICSPAGPRSPNGRPCTKQAVFNLMQSKLKFVAPALSSNENNSVRQCGVYGLIPLLSGNYITTTVDESNFRITNYTNPAHILHPGKIERTIINGASGSVIVQTIGQGEGPYGAANIPFGLWLFGMIDQDLVNAF